jgi:arsenate reductase
MWLDKKDVKYQLIDIIKDPPLCNYLNLALEQYSSDKKRIFNIRGKAFKSINLDIYSLSGEEIIQLLMSDGKLIKRPFLVYEEKKVILGFNEIEYAKEFM